MRYTLNRVARRNVMADDTRFYRNFPIWAGDTAPPPPGTFWTVGMLRISPLVTYDHVDQSGMAGSHYPQAQL